MTLTSYESESEFEFGVGREFIRADSGLLTSFSETVAWASRGSMGVSPMFKRPMGVPATFADGRSERRAPVDTLGLRLKTQTPFTPEPLIGAGFGRPIPR
jgi:hypothetical protein